MSEPSLQPPSISVLTPLISLMQGSFLRVWRITSPTQWNLHQIAMSNISETQPSLVPILQPKKTVAQPTPEPLGRGQECRVATQGTSFYDHRYVSKWSRKGVVGMDRHCSPWYGSFDEEGRGRISFPRAEHPPQAGTATPVRRDDQR